MNVLITGGAGYLGSVLAKKLLEKKYNVTVFDNFFYNQKSLSDICHYKNFDVVNEDVRDIQVFKSYIKKNDIIIPLAALVGAPICQKYKKLAIDVNETQIKNLFKEISKNQAIILPVTNSGYGIGKKDKFCDENTPLNPISHYGITKVNAERIALENGNAVSLRLATVFGSSPRMRTDLLVNDFVLRAYKDKYIVLFESHFKRNYIHIQDVANTIIFSINNYQKMQGQSYNVGLSNANLSKFELCQKIKKYINDFDILKSEINEDPDKRDYIVSNKKLESLNWKPKYSLDDGIKELIKLYSYLKFNNFNNI
tara:strand:- start:11262 stop:12194 length:933 start_codon:yes stop_codon:yes gene_type:complete